MSGVRLTDEQCLDRLRAYKKFGSLKAASEATGLGRQAIRQGVDEARRRKLDAEDDGLELPDFPADDLPIDRILDMMEERSQLRMQSYEAHTWFPVKVKDTKAIGILWFGDPHLDDNGCDIRLIRRYADLCRATDGLYGANIGDSSNNWSGRLAALYAKQDTSKKTAKRLVEWFMLDSGIKLRLLGNHDCVTPDHEVLTKRGWVKLPDVRSDDNVLGHNERTGHAEWQSINEIVQFPYKGKLAHYSTNTVSIVCTSNHRFLSKVKGGNFKYRHQFELPDDVSIITASHDGAEGCGLSEDKIRLAALVLTDGGISKHGYVSIYQSKPEVCDVLEGLLSRLNLSYSKNSRVPRCTHINGVELKSKKTAHHYILTASASKAAWYVSKTIVSWMYKMNDAEMSTFMRAICLGDGSIKKNGDTDKVGWAVNGAKKELEALQALLVCKGWSASMYTDPRGGARLNVFRKSVRRLVGPPKYVDYDGDVWCLRVPLSNFMVRHDGRAHFTGNSWGDGADILALMAAKHKTQRIVCHDWEARFILQFKNGCEIRVNAAHDFPGNSMWNPLHGTVKAAKFGDKIDLLVCGHRHNWAVASWEMAAQGNIPVMIRVKGFKTYDNYAQRLGHYEQREGSAILTVIDPNATTKAGRVQAFADVEAGVEFLKWLRSR